MKPCPRCGDPVEGDHFDYAAALVTLRNAVFLVRDGQLGRRSFATRDRTVGEALDDALNVSTRAGTPSRC